MYQPQRQDSSVEDQAVDLLLCQSEQDYNSACSSPERGSRTIPILQGSSPWPIQKVFGIPAEHLPSLSPTTCSAPVDSQLSLKRTLEWARTYLCSTTMPDQKTRAAVLASECPGAAAAAVLSRALGYPLQICRGDFLANLLAEIRAKPGFPVIIVACLDELTDELLMGLAYETHSALASGVPWDHLPRVTLLTGRNLASLSWVVAKAIAAACQEPTPSSDIHFAHYATDGKSILLSELNGNPQEGFRTAQRTLDRGSLITSLASPFTVVAYQTHGVDSCAQGGDGAVLCGLYPSTSVHDPNAPGILACARGYACPRGPYPLPLREIQANTFILNSCNGLRLADSPLHSDFNLGLSFIDGPGCSYVSSIMAGFGSEVGSLCFLAALASGRSLGDATLLTNAFIHAAGLDIPSYVALGLPHLRAVSPLSEIKPHWNSTASAERPFRHDFGNQNLGELVLDAPGLIELAQKAQLSLSLSSAGDQPIYWFSRLEQWRGPDASSSVSAKLVLRLYMFRFPDPLGTVEITIHDVERLRRRTRVALESLRRWAGVIRLAMPGQQNEAFCSELIESETLLRRTVARSVKALDLDGSAQENIERLVKRAESFAELARDYSLEDLVPKLTGPFWLSNALAEEYHLVSSRQTACPNCHGIALRKVLRHALDRDARDVIVCLRCLIVSDLPHRGDIRSLLLDTPELVKAGTTLIASIQIAGRSRSSVEVKVYPRITTRAGKVVMPRPLESACELAAKPSTLTFQFELPHDMLPHQYQLKVLAASLNEIAFAQRPFFLRSP